MGHEHLSAQQLDELTPNLESSLSMLVSRAREGDASAREKINSQCRNYLLLVANEELDQPLHAKCASSDLVQNTLIAAAQHFEDFRGDDRKTLLAWLRRNCSMNCTTIALMASLALGCAMSQAAAQTSAARTTRPDWSRRDTSEIFFADAFRDAFDGKSPFPQRAEVVAALAMEPTSPGGGSAGKGWANALDSQLLIDEIKAIANRSQKNTRSARSFADDARDETRRDFTIAAVLFRMLDEWEGNVRFKRQAAAASAAMSTAAQAIAAPSGKTLEQAKRTSEDLTDIVRGNQPLPTNVKAPSWETLVRRDDFMWRLDTAIEETIADGLDSERALEVAQDQLAQEANLAAALLAALRQESAIDAEQAGYVEFARQAEREATALRSAISELDFARGKDTLQKLRQSCEACHEVYQ